MHGASDADTAKHFYVACAGYGCWHSGGTMGYATGAWGGGPWEEGLVVARFCCSGDLEEEEIGRRIFQLTGLC